MDLQDTKTETASREIQAASHQAVRFVGAGAPIVLLPEGFTAEDLSHMLAAPTRKKGTV